MPETLSSLQDLKGAAAPAPEAAPRYVQKLDPQGRAYATGKRKDAVARVWIKPGPGKAQVNGKALELLFRARRAQDDPAAAAWHRQAHRPI